MAIIARLTAQLVAWSIPQRLARPLAWVIIIVVPLLLLAKCAGAHWLSKHDQAVVTKDRDAAKIDALGRTLDADRGAGAAKDARDRAFTNEQANLQEKTDAAADNGTSPLDALFDGLR